MKPFQGGLYNHVCDMLCIILNNEPIQSQKLQQKGHQLECCYMFRITTFDNGFKKQCRDLQTQLANEFLHLTTLHGHS